MTKPSSSPRGERVGRPGATWDRPRTEVVIPDDAPDPRPGRAERRALARAARRNKPMTDQQEQAAPVDWQAIAQQRERELKTVGEARHRAEQERDEARQRAADAYGQRDRLRQRIAALAERWQLPGHISMPSAAAEIAEALDREKWAPAPDPLTHVRDLADRWENALAPDRAYARALRAALEGPTAPTEPKGRT